VPLVLDYADRVSAVAFSPDGRTLATATWDGSIRLQDLNDARSEPITLSGHGGWIFSIGFSPDGRMLAAGSMDWTARLWDLAHPAEPVELAHEAEVDSVVFSQDGAHLVTGSWLGIVRFWDVAEVTATPLEIEIEGRITAMGLNPDGTLLAVGNANETVSLCDLTHPAVPPVVLLHGDWVVSVAFSLDDTTLGTCGEQTAQLWDLGGPDATPLARLAQRSNHA
jgi:WD40 repeat protein